MLKKYLSLVVLLLSLSFAPSTSFATIKYWFQTPQQEYTVAIVSTRKEAKKNLKTAISWWNTVLGHEIFKEVKELKNADVWLFDVPLPTWGVLGECRHPGLLGPTPIFIYRWTQSPITYAHELGHALGLEHDEDNSLSLMHPYLQGDQGFTPDIIEALQYKFN